MQAGGREGRRQGGRRAGAAGRWFDLVGASGGGGGDGGRAVVSRARAAHVWNGTPQSDGRTDGAAIPKGAKKVASCDCWDGWE